MLRGAWGRGANSAEATAGERVSFLAQVYDEHVLLYIIQFDIKPWTWVPQALNPYL